MLCTLDWVVSAIAIHLLLGLQSDDLEDLGLHEITELDFDDRIDQLVTIVDCVGCIFDSTRLEAICVLVNDDTLHVLLILNQVVAINEAVADLRTQGTNGFDHLEQREHC
jgi:hypothetical protein